MSRTQSSHPAEPRAPGPGARPRSRSTGRGLELARHLRPERLPLAFQQAAQALDQELADHDGRDHPRDHARARDRRQVDVAARDDHLVDQRVELAADRRVLLEQAGEIAVERIGQSRRRRRPPAPARTGSKAIRAKTTTASPSRPTVSVLGTFQNRGFAGAVAARGHRSAGDLDVSAHGMPSRMVSECRRLLPRAWAVGGAASRSRRTSRRAAGRPGRSPGPRRSRRRPGRRAAGQPPGPSVRPSTSGASA